MWNSKQLALRDPARAALLGVIAGTDFGSQAFTPGDDYGFGDDDDDDDAGYGFGDDEYGFGAAAKKHKKAAMKAKAAPTPAKVAAVWHEHNAKKAHAQSRLLRLDPNLGSSVKIEKYVLSMSQVFVLGTGGAFDTNLAQSPSTDFRPQLLSFNAPVPGLAYMTSLAVANVLANIGTGAEDCYMYNPNAWGRDLDLPTLTPSNKLIIGGTFGTFVPPGYVNGASYTFSASVKGPANLAGGGIIRG